MSRTDGKLRLLFVSHSFPPLGKPLENLGGMQRVATELHAALARHPDVELHSLLLETSWRWTHVRVFPFLAGLLHRIPRLVKRERIDVVFFSSMVTATLAPELRRRPVMRGVRLATVVHGLDITTAAPLWQRIVRRTFRTVDRVAPISRATAEEALRRGVPPERMRVVHNGVDLRRFPPPGDRAEARRELLRALGPAGEGIPDGALLLCSVGRHVERKGFAWFAREVVPRLPEGVVWLLAGEGPETPAVREALSRRGVEEKVRLLGRVPEELLQRLYHGSDLFIMPNVPIPNDMEGFGMVVLEAALSGLPTLGARLEGIQDSVTEGENGILVESGDAAAFVEVIDRLRNDRGELARMSGRARRYVESTYGWAGVADRYVRFIAEGLRTWTPRPADADAGEPARSPA